MYYWLIADGGKADQWDAFYSEGIVRITGRQELGDLQKYALLPLRELEIALKGNHVWH